MSAFDLLILLFVILASLTALALFLNAVRFVVDVIIWTFKLIKLALGGHKETK